MPALSLDSPQAALCLHKSTVQPSMEYCCHVWAGASSCYLELLDKLQKYIFRTVGSSLAASLEPLAHCRNVPSLTFFYRYYFGRCSPELAQLVSFPYSQGRSTHYSNRLHDFSVTIPRYYYYYNFFSVIYKFTGNSFVKRASDKMDAINNNLTEWQ